MKTGGRSNPDTNGSFTTIDNRNDNESATNNNSSTVVMVLCGLPASGKSTLAQWIVNHYQQYYQQTTQTQIQVVHLEYDSVEQGLLAKAAEETGNDAANHNHSNNSSSNGESDPSNSTFTREIWKQSRLECLERLRVQLSLLQQQPDASTSSSPKLILMDDNFHLRSMRRQVYRLCQDFSDRNMYFAIAWLDIPSEICLLQNQQRPPRRQVPRDVIAKMKDTLEPPGKESWEQCYLQITKLPSSIVDRGHHDNHHTIDKDDNAQSIVDFITRISHNYQPVPPPLVVVDEEQLEDERRKTKESWLHSWDQHLRTWVGIVAQLSRTDTGRANQARKQLLQRLRHCQHDNNNDNNSDELPDSQQVIQWFLADMQVQHWTEDQVHQFYLKAAAAAAAAAVQE